MSNWKQKIHDMEIAPPQSMWAEIEQKRHRPWWSKCSAIAPILVVCIALTFYKSEEQESNSNLKVPSIAETKSIEPTNSSTKEPTKFNQSILPSPLSTEVSIAELPFTELEQSNNFYPYNGRIVTRQNENYTAAFLINTPENATSLSTTGVDAEEIKPEIETPLGDSITITSSEAIEIPNVFSPNGDGWNDEFSPSDYLPEGSQLLEWKLFRNGKFVQSWRDNSPWKGLDGGDFPMSNGLYQYVIYYTTSLNEFKSFSGNISIQR